MICPKCKELGQKSSIRIGGSVTTCMSFSPYYDEEGVYHNHDGNITRSSYTCSLGHLITIRSTNKCLGCNWGHEGAEQITVEDVGQITVNTANIGIIKYD